MPTFFLMNHHFVCVISVHILGRFSCVCKLLCDRLLSKRLMQEICYKQLLVTLVGMNVEL